MEKYNDNWANFNAILNHIYRVVVKFCLKHYENVYDSLPFYIIIYILNNCSRTFNLMHISFREHYQLYTWNTQYSIHILYNKL